MARIRMILLALLLVPFLLPAQDRIHKKLQREIETLVKGFKGNVGVYIKSLNSRWAAAYNADTVFPTASMIKIPILIGVMDKINKKELSYDQELIYTDSLLYAGVDILGSYKNGEKTSIGKVMMLMLTMSDNTASLWLQSLAGTGTRINAILDSLGFKSTRVNSRTPGREANRTEYGWGQTTPREMVMLMEKIYKREMISPSISEKMLRLLGRNYWDGVAISQIPPTVFVASKNGAVNQSRSETLLIMSPRGPYAISIITKNIEDQRWTPDNEAWVLMRKITRMLWQHLDPKSAWRPPTPVEGNNGVN